MCLDCQMAKSHALLFKTSLHVSNKPLVLIFTDVRGLASIISNSGARQYVSFLDDCTKFLWLFPLKLKSNVEKVVLQFQAYIERFLKQKLKPFNLIEKVNIGANQYFKNHGTQHRLAYPYTHQQMGSIEHQHRQIIEISLTLLSHSNLNGYLYYSLEQVLFFTSN